jgi:putative chitinase
MCIANSVGQSGMNNLDDVKTVQILINLQTVNPTPGQTLAESGRIDTPTFEAIGCVQALASPGMTGPSLVAPASRALQYLRTGMRADFVSSKLHGIMIHAAPQTVLKYFSPLVQTMAKYEINTPLRKAHFLSQVGHESAELRYTCELASGEKYEGRADLGNLQPGDGHRFRGRGLIQITGRANYAAFSVDHGSDYTSDSTAPLLSADPSLAVEASGWFWKKKQINQLADRDDLVAVTRRVNGGVNGLAQRGVLLARARFFLT